MHNGPEECSRNRKRLLRKVTSLPVLLRETVVEGVARKRNWPSSNPGSSWSGDLDTSLSSLGSQSIVCTVGDTRAPPRDCCQVTDRHRAVFERPGTQSLLCSQCWRRRPPAPASRPGPLKLASLPGGSWGKAGKRDLIVPEGPAWLFVHTTTHQPAGHTRSISCPPLESPGARPTPASLAARLGATPSPGRKARETQGLAANSSHVSPGKIYQTLWFPLDT